MKTVKIIILSALLVFFCISCKEKSADTLPREAYVQNPEGITMKSSPSVKSGMAAVIPFGEKLILTENSANDHSSSSEDKTSRWYKTSWSGKSGWIQESSTGTAESVPDQIKVSFAEQKANLTGDSIKSFDASPVKINEKFIYPGGDMSQARMFFLAGGIMVLNSKIFTENYSNTFFQYEFLSDGKLLKIKFIDTRLNFNEYADMENSSKSVFKIDKTGYSITYQVKERGFFFLNWVFYRE